MNEFVKLELSSKQQGFSYIHDVTNGEQTSNMHLDKELFSLLLLKSGDVDYVIEGKPIHLYPKDILLVGNNELHRGVFRKDLDSEYLLFMINLDFFVKHNCTELSNMFFNRALGSNNVVSSDKVLGTGIYEIVERFDKYARQKNPNMVVLRSVIIELLYNLDKQVQKTEKTNRKQEKIKDIIEYINENLTEKISLELIASKFYLTREYLCKLFKECTGFTVNKYIAYKRIVLAREYNLNGMPLTIACEKVGFSDYSAFYRAYQKIMNESPSQGTSKI